jgi:hypothetical protein
VPVSDAYMANQTNIPEPIRWFLHKKITSSAQLEALLLIAEPTALSKERNGWSVAEVTAELRSEFNLIAAALAGLVEGGLLVESSSPADAETRFRFSPSTELLREHTEGLAVLYRERRHSILAVIYEPREQSSGSAIDPARAFSDAFRFRGRRRDEEE